MVKEFEHNFLKIYEMFEQFTNCYEASTLSNTLPKTPCPPSHLGTWLCEGGGHGSEAAVSGKLV